MALISHYREIRASGNRSSSRDGRDEFTGEIAAIRCAAPTPKPPFGFEEAKYYAVKLRISPRCP
jgi:hypothetical protein